MHDSATSLAIVFGVLLAAWPTRDAAAQPVERDGKGIVIFAPHPDDETLGCAGVMMRASRLKIPLRVVFLTNGDGFPRAASLFTGKDITKLKSDDFLAMAKARQQQAIDAARICGVAAESLVFLGYPDAGLMKLPTTNDGEPFRSPFTEKSETNSPATRDYHTQTHGKPAPYRRSVAIDDIVEILRKQRPSQIYVTDGADHHADHHATFELVRDAAVAAEYREEFFTYLVHLKGREWPWPAKADPKAPFESHVVDGMTVPIGVAWPPDERRPMTIEESAVKLKAIRAYTLELQFNRDYLESFVKSEEIFWRHRLAPLKK
jgi:LmbE family N-acetylglucosaminyl deacetylase